MKNNMRGDWTILWFILMGFTSLFGGGILLWAAVSSDICVACYNETSCKIINYDIINKTFFDNGNTFDHTGYVTLKYEAGNMYLNYKYNAK